MGNYNDRLRALWGAYRLWPHGGDGCAYCNVYADTYDHVPPLSVVHALGLEHFSAVGVKLWLVPACRECNSLLSSCGAQTVTERRLVARAKLRKKYAHYLRIGEWLPHELDELGPGLRQMIESGADIKGWIKRRLAHRG